MEEQGSNKQLENFIRIAIIAMFIFLALLVTFILKIAGGVNLK